MAGIEKAPAEIAQDSFNAGLNAGIEIGRREVVEAIKSSGYVKLAERQTIFPDNPYDPNLAFATGYSRAIKDMFNQGWRKVELPKENE